MHPRTDAHSTPWKTGARELTAVGTPPRSGGDVASKVGFGAGHIYEEVPARVTASAGSVWTCMRASRRSRSSTGQLARS
jgi:hypothetical protein